MKIPHTLFLTSLIHLFSCDTATLRSEVSGTLEESQGRFTGFCRPSAEECRVSCATLGQCLGVLDPQLCRKVDPEGGDYACYDRTLSNGPSQPPGGVELWEAPSCVPSPSECRYSGCSTEIFVVLDPDICSPLVSPAPYACYCKKQ